MDGHIVVRAIIVGLGVAAPVGPIGVLVMDRSIARGMALGFVTGLGAATADALFALAGALGLGELAGTAGPATSVLRVLGAVVIGALGVRTLLRAATPASATAGSGSYPAAFATTLGLTLINPLTILTFAAVAATLGLSARGACALDAALLAGGVLVGSASWWAVLSGSCAAARRRLPPSLIGWLRRGSGALLLGFAVYALVRGRA